MSISRMNGGKLELMEVDGQVVAQLVPELTTYTSEYIELATFYLYVEQFDGILKHFLDLESLGKAKRTHTLSFLLYQEEHCEIIAEIARILIPAY